MAKRVDIYEPTFWHYLIIVPIFFVIRLWQATIRMNYNESTEKILRDKSHFLGLAWHNRIFFFPIAKYKFRPKFKMSGLVSASKDGAILCAFFKLLNIDAIRGSSKRGGSQAIIKLIEALKTDSDTFITPDGPRGPRYKCKSGFKLVASDSGVRFLLVRVMPENYWSIGAAWDKFILPKPFSKFTIDVVEYKNYTEFEAAATAVGKTPEEFAECILSTQELPNNVLP